MNTSVVVLALLSVTGGLVVGACSGTPRLPPGLPPPEYERPAVTPWPPADAGTPSSLETAPAEVADPALTHAVAGSAGAPAE